MLPGFVSEPHASLQVAATFRKLCRSRLGSLGTGAARMNRTEPIRTPPRRLTKVDRFQPASAYPVLAGIGSGLVASYGDLTDDRIPERLLWLLERLEQRSPLSG